MAYTKIIPIHNTLNRSVNYAYNEEKTSLETEIDYAMNRSKTEKTCFESAFNCQRETAYQEMMATKERWKKTRRMKSGRPHVLGYHIIQSFKPGETDPHTAHEIGRQLAQRCFGDKYEVIVSTHLDKSHLHNHIVINSVSFMDGRMYRNNFKDYFRDIRGTSDDLCREYGLSVIEPGMEPNARHYAGWKAQKEGKPDRYTMIREDIDEVLVDCVSMKQFISRLKSKGYTFRNGNNAHIAFTPPGWEKRVRLNAKTLGENYSQEAILKRISRNIPEESVSEALHVLRQKAVGSKISSTSQSFLSNPTPTICKIHCIVPRKKLSGFRALYVRYLYTLHVIPKRQQLSPEMRYYLRAQHWKLEKTKAEMRFIAKHTLRDLPQLNALEADFSSQMNALSAERSHLHSQKRGASDEVYALLKGKTDALTATIRGLRRNIKMCAAIRENSTYMRGTIHKVREDIRIMEKAKIRYEEVDTKIDAVYTKRD